jgi:glycosyltransferase involved in cell wall biosynthesis
MGPSQAVAIDYTAALSQGGGIGRYTRELVRLLAEIDQLTDYRLFAAGQRPDHLPAPPGANFIWKPSRIGAEWFARLWHRAHLPLPVETWVGPVGLFHATDFTLPPCRAGTRTLLTVHDLSFVRAPETATRGLRSFLNRVVPRSVARADHVLADSEATRHDLIELYQAPPSKVSVLYPGVDSRFAPVEDAEALRAVRARYSLGDEPFVLSVGTVQPRKNYVRLAEAFARLAIPGVRLVIAGGKGWLADPLHARIGELGIGDRVTFAGFVDDDDLPALYSAAAAFAYPSLYEGFGLPPLEAMACGVPVVVSNTSSLPEVTGDAAVQVDPYAVDALSAALQRVLTDHGLRAELREKGRQQAQQFTWDAAARQLHSLYSSLLHSM